MSKTKKSSGPIRHDNHGVMRDYIKTKAGPFGISGKTRAILILAGFGLGAFYIYKKINNKSKLKKLDSETSASVMAYMLKRKADAELFERKRDAYSKQPDNEVSEETAYVNEQDLVDWQTNYQRNRKQILIDFPPIINTLVAGAPEGYEESTIAVATAILATCFSMVEAYYNDNKWHRPNMFVCVEGLFGSGKGKFKSLYDALLARRIKRDREKLASENPENKIIQTVSATTTSSRLIDILANNQGVHCLGFEPEVKTFINAMKKSNSFGFDVIRKAYDNDEVVRMNKDKNSPQGCFPVVMNLILTGTPGDMSDFIKKELEGGTSSRYCWCVIPPVGRELPVFNMPEGEELSFIHDMIDSWTNRYSYTTDGNGNDIAVQPFQIDLNYVNEALREWNHKQWDQGVAEENPTRMAVHPRIAATAFHSAIVYHMLYGNPTPKEHSKRKAVVDLTLYMADYYIERYIHKFSKTQNELHKQYLASEQVPTRHQETKASAPASHPNWRSDIPEATVKGWYDRFQQGEGYKSLAKGTTYSHDRVRSQLSIYARLYNLPLRTDKAVVKAE